MMQRMILSNTDYVMERVLKTEHTKDAEKALMDVLSAGHATIANSLNDASYSYIESTLSEKTL